MGPRLRGWIAAPPQDQSVFPLLDSPLQTAPVPRRSVNATITPPAQALRRVPTSLDDPISQSPFRHVSRRLKRCPVFFRHPYACPGIAPHSRRFPSFRFLSHTFNLHHPAPNVNQWRTFILFFSCLLAANGVHYIYKSPRAVVAAGGMANTYLGGIDDGNRTQKNRTRQVERTTRTH